MAATWQRLPTGYALDHAGLRAELAIREVTPGLRDIVRSGDASGVPWPGPVLGVDRVQTAGRQRYAVVFARKPIHRLRSDMVDIEIEPTQTFPFRMQLYWQASCAGQIDLEVLVTTDLVLQHLEVVTLSQLPRGELLTSLPGTRGWHSHAEVRALGHRDLVVPRDRTSARFSLDGRLPSFRGLVLAGPYRMPVVLHRPAERDWSYVEMSHPDDCARLILLGRPRHAQVSFGLFGLNVEKGVILRGRLRGAFVPRAEDSDHAAALYDKFLRESPRLSV